LTVRKGPASRPAGAARKRPTINDVARLAGVSKKTVSRVINDSPFVRGATREKIAALIAELGFVPDPQARALAVRQSHLIGLVYVPPAPAALIDGVLDGLKGSGCELVLRLYDAAALRDFAERQKLRGLISLVPLRESLDCPVVTAQAQDDGAAVARALLAMRRSGP
jgi:DNA-binding LacI/PurR family transcriptional regulator